MIQREVVLCLAPEFLQHLLVVTLNPSCRRHIDRLELAFDFVLVAQAMCDDVELERPDRAEYQVVVAQRPEQLRSTLLAELRKPFLQRLEA